MHRGGRRGRALAPKRGGALVLGLFGALACGELPAPEVEPEVPAGGEVAGAPSVPRDCDELLERFHEQLHEQIRERVASTLSRYTEGGGEALASAEPLLGSRRASSGVTPDLNAARDAPAAAPSAAAARAARDPAAAPSAAAARAARDPAAAPSPARDPAAARAAPDPVAPSPATGAAPAASANPFSAGDILAIEEGLLYLVKGDYLHVLDIASASAIELRASLSIEGEARQLLVRDGTVFVFSAVSPPSDPSQPYVPPPPGYYPSYSKLTVVDARSEAPAVVRETYLEGAVYGAVRRRGERALVTLQQSVKVRVDYPDIAPLDAFGRPVSAERMAALLAAWAEIRAQSIETSTLADFLPRTQERVGEGLVAAPFSCTEHLVPAGGPGTSYFTRLVTIDLSAAEAALGELTFLGEADSVSAGDDVVLLREPDPYGYGSPHTNLHRVEVDGPGARVTGTGRLDGYLDGLFVLDEVGGVIRAAVTSTPVDRALEVGHEGGEGSESSEGSESIGASRVSHVVTLDAHSPRLQELGRSGPFGQGEGLAGGVFFGSQGYLSLAGDAASTLHVLDLGDPEHPTLAGRVTTRASTPLLLPLSDGRVLGIGEVLDDASGWSVALQQLDVSDPTAPRLVDEYESPKPGRLTTVDARAVMVDLGSGLLALRREDDRAGANVMDLFQLPASEGFAHVGLVLLDRAYIGREACLSYWGYPSDPEALTELGLDLDEVEVLLGRCEGMAGAGVRRSFVAGDFLVSLTVRGIAVHALGALAAPPQYEIDLPGTVYPWN